MGIAIRDDLAYRIAVVDIMLLEVLGISFSSS